MVRRTTGWLAAAVVAIGTLGIVAGCSDENKRWEAAQESAEKRAQAKADGELPKAADGATLNTFFPPDGTDGLKRSFDQEKEGFAQAKFSKDGLDATLSISDVVQNDAARAKFDGAEDKLGDDPVTTVGKNQTTALIARRWQIKVSSQQMDHPARRALLEKFDLAGLRAFQPSTR
jgi:hypothetical protein